MKRLALVLLILLLGAVPAQADWQRKSITGGGTDLEAGKRIVSSTRGRHIAVYHFTADLSSSWLTIARGARVSIFLNTNTAANTANDTEVNILFLKHNIPGITPVLNDSGILLNTRMTFTEDQFYDLDGPAKILVDVITEPAVSGAYVTVVVTNPPVKE
jgi:hypothetical protein